MFMVLCQHSRINAAATITECSEFMESLKKENSPIEFAFSFKHGEISPTIKNKEEHQVSLLSPIDQ